MVEGFGQNLQDVQGLAAQQQSLRAAVDAGRLRMEPGTAERAAGCCRAFAADLEDELPAVRELAEIDGFGECIAGRALRDAFRAKGEGTPTSAREIIREHQRVLEDLAQTFEAAGRAYHAADEAGGQMFGGPL